MNKETKDIAVTISVVPRLMHYFMGAFKPEVAIPLKKNEIKAIFEIDRHPFLPMKHYADAVDMEFGSFTYLTDKLEKKGIVERAQSQKDKRIIVLALTKEGKALSEEIKDKFEVHISELISTLNQEDLEKLSTATGLLEDIYSKLEMDK